MYTKGVTNVIKRKRKKNSLFKSHIILSAKKNMVVEKKGLENWYETENFTYCNLEYDVSSAS